jgi:hypothetical protein
MGDRIQGFGQVLARCSLSIQDFAFHGAIGEEVDDDLRLIRLHGDFLEGDDFEWALGQDETFGAVVQGLDFGMVPEMGRHGLLDDRNVVLGLNGTKELGGIADRFTDRILSKIPIVCDQFKGSRLCSFKANI